MAKLRCPNCANIFDVEVDENNKSNEPKLTCPYCGKVYSNPYYVAPVEQVPATQTSTAAQPLKARGKSTFTGGLGSLIGLNIVNFFILLFTLGFGTPWVVCRSYSWEVEHQIVDGYKLVFDGKAGDLFVQWIKWFLLTIITFGIYGLWLNIKIKKWIAEHTHLEIA